MHKEIQEIKKLIEKGLLDSPSTLLVSFSRSISSRFYHEALVNHSNIQRLLADERKSLISKEYSLEQQNRMAYKLLAITSEIEKEISSEASKDSSISRQDSKITFNSAVENVTILTNEKANNYLTQKMKKNKVIEISGNAQISAPIVIADHIESSFNALANTELKDDLKNLFEILLKEIANIGLQVDSEEASESVQEMSQDAETLIKESAKKKPRQKWYEISIQGLKDSATALGEIATPILKIVEQISEFLLA